MLNRTRDILRRIARVALPKAPALPERPPLPPAIPPGSPMSLETEAEYLEECRSAGLDPNHPDTNDRLDEIRMQRTCAARGLDPASPTIQDEINQQVLEELSQDE